MRLVHPLLALLVASAVACGDDGPTGPTPPGSGGDGTGISGHTVDAVTGAPLGGITVRVTGYGDVVSDSDGTFIVDGTLTGASERRPLTASSMATIERSTFLRVPADNARLSLIPASFDLASFDAMFRGDDGILRRWTAPPPLVIERSALVFTDIDARRFTAADDVMSESEAAQLVTDLEWALDELSAGTFTRFASVRIERAEPGASVSTTRADAIFVARYARLGQSTNFDGYTRWFWNSDGQVVRATMMLDRDYDGTAPTTSRRALRAHELGHALGWRHLEGRASVMNPRNPRTPTAFDRAGAAIAFQRPPLNRSPDVDASPATINRLDDRIYSAGDY